MICKETGFVKEYEGDALGMMRVYTKMVKMNQTIDGPVNHSCVLILEGDFNFLETDGQ